MAMPAGICLGSSAQLVAQRVIEGIFERMFMLEAAKHGYRAD
jgi:hypothetical protein